MSHPLPPGLFERLLDETDRFAVETVRSGQGGPFGASLHVFNHDHGQHTEIGGLAANAVLRKGIASAHAESESLNPASIRMLKDCLAENRGRELTVIHISSAESCPACAAKEEILAQHLVAEGLLPPGRFLAPYAATFEQTLEVADFNDIKYVRDMEKGCGQGKIPVRAAVDMPVDIRRGIDRAAAEQTRIAIVRMKDGHIFTGYDNRDEDMMETAEVHALRQANTWQKSHGVKNSWDLTDAVLYTMCPRDQVGPLTMAESLWADIARIECAWDDRMLGLPYQEAALMTNDRFYELIANRAHAVAGGAVTFLHAPNGFRNAAQQVWRREVLDVAEDRSAVLYNGTEFEP